jgi:undecaprenyl-diphosphatase
MYSTRPEWSEFHQRLILALWLGLLAGGIAMAVWASIDDHFPADITVGRWLQDNSPGGQSVIDFVRDVGSSIASVVTIVVVSAGLFISGRRRMAVVALLVLGGIAFQAILKELVDRPRTSIDFLVQRAGFDSPSFPSGHTMSSVLVAGLLVYLAVRVPAPSFLRAPIAVWGLGLGFLSPWIAVSGGVHWPSDALGGAAWAWAFLIPIGVLMEAARRADARHERPGAEPAPPSTSESRDAPR